LVGVCVQVLGVKKWFILNKFKITDEIIPAFGVTYMVRGICVNYFGAKMVASHTDDVMGFIFLMFIELNGITDEVTDCSAVPIIRRATSGNWHVLRLSVALFTDLCESGTSVHQYTQ
jgi:hypothetical protein